MAQSRKEANVYEEDQRPLRVELYGEIDFSSLLNKLPSVSQVLEYLSILSAQAPKGLTCFGCLRALSALVLPKCDSILDLFVRKDNGISVIGIGVGSIFSFSQTLKVPNFVFIKFGE